MEQSSTPSWTWTVIGVLAVGLIFSYLNPDKADVITKAVIAAIGVIGLVYMLSAAGGNSRLRTLIFSTLAVVVLLAGAGAVFSLFNPLVGGIAIGVVAASTVALGVFLSTSRKTM